MDSKIIQQLQEAFSEEFELVRNDLAALEAAVMGKMQSLGRGFLQRLIDREPNGYRGSSTACRCGGSMRFIQHRPKDIQTVFGWIKLRRAYYHCPDCCSSLIPYDLDSGLGSEQLSPALAKACCLLAVDDSFARVSGKLQELFGLKVSERSVERIVHRVGSVALGQRSQQLEDFFADRQIPQAQIKAQRLYVTADGTTVHETDGWHEVKVGCIYWQDERFDSHKHYVAGFDNSEVFGWRLWLEACGCGMREAKELVYIGDGAGWIRSEHGKHFNKATFIIDWYHACQRVWNCGKVLFGEGTDKTGTWVNERLALLWDGWTKRLLDDLQQQRRKYRGRKRDAIDTLYRYISVNKDQMCYDAFRARGYDISSGLVEAACKHVVGKRLKQSGMIWSRAGSSATLALRVTWLNNKWTELWSKKPLAA